MNHTLGKWMTHLSHSLVYGYHLLQKTWAGGVVYYPFSVALRRSSLSYVPFFFCLGNIEVQMVCLLIMYFHKYLLFLYEKVFLMIIFMFWVLGYLLISFDMRIWNKIHKIKSLTNNIANCNNVLFSQHEIEVLKFHSLNF